MKIKQPQHTVLNTNNKIIYHVAGKQDFGCILDPRLYMHYLEYATKGHKAMHTILFKFKMALFFSFLVV